MGDRTDTGSNERGAALGRIRTKRVAVAAPGAGDRTRSAAASGRNSGTGASRGADPRMNRLVPYLDLFGRLGDEELSRLAQVPTSVVAELRKQVDEIGRALARYVDLLPRLTNEELSRLTGANRKTIQFWRLCQPRGAGLPEPVDTTISSPMDVHPPPSSSSRMRVADVTGDESRPAAEPVLRDAGDEVPLSIQE